LAPGTVTPTPLRKKGRASAVSTSGAETVSTSGAETVSTSGAGAEPRSGAQ
jgi:hypothetical protein